MQEWFNIGWFFNIIHLINRLRNEIIQLSPLTLKRRLRKYNTHSLSGKEATREEARIISQPHTQSTHDAAARSRGHTTEGPAESERRGGGGVCVPARVAPGAQADAAGRQGTVRGQRFLVADFRIVVQKTTRA